MNFTLAITLGVLQIILQAIAAYYSYRIFSFNRLNWGWLAMTFALVLMTFRRVTAILIETKFLSVFSGIISDLDKIILPAVISVFLLVGLFVMFKNFRNFDLIEKKVKSKIREVKRK